MSNSARNAKKKFLPPPLPPFFLKIGKIYVKRRLFNFLTYILRLKPSLITTDCFDICIVILRKVIVGFRL